MKKIFSIIVGSIGLAFFVMSIVIFIVFLAPLFYVVDTVFPEKEEPRGLP